MKKILYISIFFLSTLLMVACDDKYSFKLDVDNVSELRESIVFDLTLKDDNDDLKNSEVKGEITRKDSKVVISTKDVSFSKEDKTATVEFKSLTADTEYTVTFYAGYDGKKVQLYKENHKTSNEGTEDIPYSIDSFDDLTNIVKKDPNGHFKLINDIDCGGKSISPLFTSSKPFAGTFDGNGKSIKNFKLSTTNSTTNEPTHSSQSSQYYGLFGYIGEKGSVCDLTLDSFDIMVKRSNDSESHYGLLAGYCAGEVKGITVINSKFNVRSEKTVKEKFNIGGLIGKLSTTGKISDVSVKADITVYSKIDAVVGGVVATTAGASIIEKVVDGKTIFVSNIDNAKFEGNITVKLEGSAAADSKTSIGGIIGVNYSAIITNCDSTGKISLTSDFTTVGNQGLTLGGLAGKNQNPNSKIAKSTSNMEFYVETKDAPSKLAEGSKDKQKELQILVGLLVGVNKGIVAECTYTKPENASYEIHVDSSEFVKTNVHVIARADSTYVYDVVLTDNVEYTVYSYGNVEVENPDKPEEPKVEYKVTDTTVQTIYATTAE